MVKIEGRVRRVESGYDHNTRRQCPVCPEKAFVVDQFFM